MNALILVDIQNDFVAGGALAVPNGMEVVSVANSLIPRFDHVVATQDWHPSDHGSFASQHDGVSIGDLFQLDGLPQVAWPDHCVQGSTAAEFVPELNLDGVTRVFQKGMDPKVDSYSGFFDNDRRQATGLDAWLKSRRTKTVYVMGLATDYCVKFTALDAIDCGLKTRLIIDGCRGVNLNPGDVERAVTELREAGVEIARSEDVLQHGT